jgi:hypothetical protein
VPPPIACASGARPQRRGGLHDLPTPIQQALRKSATEQFAQDAQNCVGEFCASSANPEEFEYAAGVP